MSWALCRPLDSSTVTAPLHSLGKEREAGNWSWVGRVWEARFDSGARAVDQEVLVLIRKSPNRRRTRNAAYATDAGTVNSTSVPVPLSLHNANRAPIRLARSRIPGNPQ